MTTPVWDSGDSALARAAVRNTSIDAFRVVANFAVICVHTGPFMAASLDADVRSYAEVFNQFVRISTPFFFLAAGYFFASSLARGAEPMPLAVKLIKRLLVFFVFWSAVYVLLPIDTYLHAPDAGYFSAVQVMLTRVLSPRFLLNGTKIHLWFLPALACSIAMLAVAVRLRLQNALFALTVALYVLGLLGGAYKDTPIGIDLHINTRNGPFFGSLFVVSGFMLQRAGFVLTVARALALIGLGIVLRAAELFWITGVYGTAPSGIDYLIGTYPFGIGILALLLTTNRFGRIDWLVKLSRYSAGVYCAHVLIIDCLKSTASDNALWEIARPFAALGLTFALVLSLARIPLFKRVVS